MYIVYIDSEFSSFYYLSNQILQTWEEASRKISKVSEKIQLWLFPESNSSKQHFLIIFNWMNRTVSKLFHNCFMLATCTNQYERTYSLSGE